MTTEEKVEQAIKQNKVLAEQLKDPEKKKAYIEKMKDELHPHTGGLKSPLKRVCDTCQFAHGENVFENSPQKAYCGMYPKADGKMKPKDVYFQGGQCLYYVKDRK